MEKKKSHLQKAPLAASVNTQTAIVNVVQSTSKSVSAINERIADLLFDFQSDNSSDSIMKRDLAKAKALAQKLLDDKKAESSTLLGIMGKCMIPGCDVHTLTFLGEIIDHYAEKSPLDPPFARAREALKNASSSTVGVIVYDSKIELIQLDGTVKAGQGGYEIS